MRFVGTFDTKKLANHFCSYLNGQEMEAQVREHDAHFEVWVLDNEHLAAAKTAFENFVANPTDPTFQVSYKDRVRKQRAQDRQLKRHYRQYFPRPGGNQITISLIVICAVIYILTLTNLRNSIYYSLFISLPGMSATTVWASQPWRLFTPMLLHFSIWHVLFNLFWLYDFGTLVETKEGKLFYIIFILLASLGSGLLQFVVAGPYFGGMSGVVYALFAYIWISAKYNLRSGYYMSNQIVFWLVGWLILCFTGILGPVANFGHLGGLIVGVVIAYLRKWRQEAGRTK